MSGMNQLYEIPDTCKRITQKKQSAQETARFSVELQGALESGLTC